MPWARQSMSTRSSKPRAAEATQRNLLRRLPGAEPGTPPREVAEAIVAAKRYFDGEEIDFSRFQLDLTGQDGFFERIYAAARRVGWGHTTTYGALAKEVGAGPEAARDVGQAMAKNPVPLIIPCHRVLAAGGKVGGFGPGWLGCQAADAGTRGRRGRAAAFRPAIVRIVSDKTVLAGHVMVRLST